MPPKKRRKENVVSFHYTFFTTHCATLYDYNYNFSYFIKWWSEYFLLQNLASLRKSIKTATSTCVRHVIPLVRMAEEYYLFKQGNSERGREPAVLLIFDTGYYTIISGWGELFDVFCKSKQIGNYTGRNVKPRQPGDHDNGESRLRILPFDHAFAFITKNITDSKSNNQII